MLVANQPILVAYCSYFLSNSCQIRSTNGVPISEPFRSFFSLHKVQHDKRTRSLRPCYYRCRSTRTLSHHPLVWKISLLGPLWRRTFSSVPLVFQEPTPPMLLDTIFRSNQETDPRNRQIRAMALKMEPKFFKLWDNSPSVSPLLSPWSIRPWCSKILRRNPKTNLGTLRHHLCNRRSV